METTSATAAADGWPPLPPVPTPVPPAPTTFGPPPAIYPYSQVAMPVPLRPLRVRPVRRPIVIPSRAGNLVWQPRFAYTAAGVILALFALVATPLGIVLYRMATSPGVALADLLPVAMLLLGAFLTAVSAWVVVVEMRARVRMVDALGRTGEHEAPGATTPVAGLRPFILIPAQVALLVVALILIAGATLIAL